ncbi:hypothetical protein CYMTET_2903 [Cymbomonas tetramitiformis]|uniref:Uncharacterized protein n=1 Tax=Cymbomonas tetramitiformis TaxID=36881 RepID=A0AAE0H4B2_9CHLO|nr:hypothetical protein CYMTET_2903 [Cymbomonas tetramitiformis]
MRVTLADGSVKTTGSTAYAKFSANTTTGTYTENALALRVLPLGIQVDVVLGDEVFLTAAQLKKHLVYAETRRLNGDDDPNLQPQWLVMAHRDDQDSEESAFAATAVDPDPSTPGDNQDAEASPEWQLKLQSLLGPDYEKEMPADDQLPGQQNL